ncbi:hypothetical protein Plhal304r1_c030g0097291 [Plasmopara halstedii]
MRMASFARVSFTILCTPIAFSFCAFCLSCNRVCSFGIDGMRCDVFQRRNRN